jgi:N utilization substance protein B
MNKRSLARQIAMQCVYQMALVKADLDDALAYFKEQENLADDVLLYARTLADGAFTHREEIDNIIRRHLHRTDFERVGNVEKSILRIAIYELQHHPETPPKVVLNEAVELAKEFTTQKSVRFVNGLLDNAAKEIKPRSKKAKTPS